MNAETETTEKNRKIKAPQAHTPGPWTYKPKTPRGPVIIGADGFMVCDIMKGEDPFPYHRLETAEANARLIASAPRLKAERDELLEALKAMYHRFAPFADEADHSDASKADIKALRAAGAAISNAERATQ